MMSDAVSPSVAKALACAIRKTLTMGTAGLSTGAEQMNVALDRFEAITAEFEPLSLC